MVWQEELSPVTVDPGPASSAVNPTSWDPSGLRARSSGPFASHPRPGAVPFPTSGDPDVVGTGWRADNFNLRRRWRLGDLRTGSDGPRRRCGGRRKHGCEGNPRRIDGFLSLGLGLNWFWFRDFCRCGKRNGGCSLGRRIPVLRTSREKQKYSSDRQYLDSHNTRHFYDALTIQELRSAGFKPSHFRFAIDELRAACRSGPLNETWSASGLAAVPPWRESAAALRRFR